jgi:hypothetical protein
LFFCSKVLPLSFKLLWFSPPCIFPLRLLSSWNYMWRTKYGWEMGLWCGECTLLLSWLPTKSIICGRATIWASTFNTHTCFSTKLRNKVIATLMWPSCSWNRPGDADMSGNPGHRFSVDHYKVLDSTPYSLKCSWESSGCIWGHFKVTSIWQLSGCWQLCHNIFFLSWATNYHLGWTCSSIYHSRI